MRSTLRALLLTCLVLGGSSEVRADLGIPTDGLDLVELTDGRVLRCVVTGRDGEYELKFASATLVVPEERVREVRYFKDFDPEPANDEEKAQVARGLIRWKGRWVKPEVAAARRKKEEEASRKQREEDEAHALWVNRRHRKTKHFQVESNVTGESLDFFVELLEDYYSHFTKYFRVKLTQRERKKKLPVFIFGNREDYWKDYEADTGGEAEHTLGYFVPVPGKEKLVLFDQPGGRRESLDVLFHEGTHFILHLAEPQVLLSRWLHEGLAEYFGSAERQGKKFVVGLVQDGRLLQFQAMIEKQRVISWDEFFRAGNPAPEGEQVRFASPHYAQAWTLAHFFLHGRKGKYARGFVDYLQRAITGRGIKYTPVAATARKFLAPDDDKALLLRCLKLKDMKALEKELFAYARELPLRGARAYVERGAYRFWNDKDQAGAEADFRLALEKGGDDAEVVGALARVFGRMPGKQAEVPALYEKALALDPLNTAVRNDYSRVLPTKDAIPQLRICIEIDSRDSDSLGDLAWLIYLEQLESPYRHEEGEQLDLARKAADFVRRAIAIDPAHRHLDTLAALLIGLGEHKEALEVAVRAVQLEPEDDGYLRRLAVAHAVNGDLAKCVKMLRRLELVLGRPAGEGEIPLPESMVRHRLSRAVEQAAGSCIAWEKGETAVRIVETWFGRKEPQTEGEWIVYASVLDAAGERDRALEVAKKGLKALPASARMKGLVLALEEEED